jgi:hypothetical protein
MKILEALIEILKGRGTRLLMVWICLCGGTALVFKMADPYPLSRTGLAGIAIFYAVIVLLVAELGAAWKRRRARPRPPDIPKETVASDTSRERKSS